MIDQLTCEQAHRLELQFGVTVTAMRAAIKRGDAPARRYAQAIRDALRDTPSDPV